MRVDPWLQYQKQYQDTYVNNIANKVQNLQKTLNQFDQSMSDFYEKLPQEYSEEEASEYLDTAETLKNEALALQAKAEEINKETSMFTNFITGLTIIGAPTGLPGVMISAISTLITSLLNLTTESNFDQATELKQNAMAIYQFIEDKHDEKLEAAKQDAFYNEVYAKYIEQSTQLDDLKLKYNEYLKKCNELEASFQRLVLSLDKLKKECEAYENYQYPAILLRDTKQFIEYPSTSYSGYDLMPYPYEFRFSVNLYVHEARSIIVTISDFMFTETSAYDYVTFNIKASGSISRYTETKSRNEEILTHITVGVELNAEYRQNDYDEKTGKWVPNDYTIKNIYRMNSSFPSFILPDNITLSEYSAEYTF